jgi:hypothetical protein
MSEADRHVALRGGNGKAFPFPFLDWPLPFPPFLGFKIESRDAFESSDSRSDSSSEMVDELDGSLRGFFDFGQGFAFFGFGEGDLEGQ